MELQFYGATERVTGSSHIIRDNGYTVLIDCGLIQGSREDEALNRLPFPFDPASIDAVVLTHGHIDHSGRLPLLVRHGFRGPVFTLHRQPLISARYCYLIRHLLVNVMPSIAGSIPKQGRINMPNHFIRVMMRCRCSTS